MNARIQELAEQAGFSKDKYDLYWDDDANAEGVDLAKFAELIVAECAMLVVTELESKVGSRIADATANRLEEHFGVEE